MADRENKTNKTYHVTIELNTRFDIDFECMYLNLNFVYHYPWDTVVGIHKKNSHFEREQQRQNVCVLYVCVWCARKGKQQRWNYIFVDRFLICCTIFVDIFALCICRQCTPFSNLFWLSLSAHLTNLASRTASEYLNHNLSVSVHPMHSETLALHCQLWLEQVRVMRGKKTKEI